MSRKSIVQKSESQLNTNQNVVNRMAEKNFEIYEFWLGLTGMSWRDAVGLSLTSRVGLEADSADRMLHAAHCA